MKLFNEWFRIPKKQLYFCSVMGCMNQTDGAKDVIGSTAIDPRERWILGQVIGDDEENEIVNLCPLHVKEFFGLSEESYKSIEVGERLAGGKSTVEEWKNAISNFR